MRSSRIRRVSKFQRNIHSLFFAQRRGLEDPEEPQLSPVVGTELQTGHFISLAQKNQKLEEKACHLTETP
jgi:hypothetical protein